MSSTGQEGHVDTSTTQHQTTDFCLLDVKWCNVTKYYNAIENAF